MKTKTFGLAVTTTALLFFSVTSFGQAGLGVSAVTSTRTNVNASAINNAAQRSASAASAANSAITRTSHASATAVTKAKNLKPQPSVKAQGVLSVASDVSVADHNSGNQSNGNGNSEFGTTVVTSGGTNVEVAGDERNDRAKNDVEETKSKMKDRMDHSKKATKKHLKKIKKQRKENHGLEVSTEARAQGEIKRNNHK